MMESSAGYNSYKDRGLILQSFRLIIEHPDEMKPNDVVTIKLGNDLGSKMQY